MMKWSDMVNIIYRSCSGEVISPEQLLYSLDEWKEQYPIYFKCSLTQRHLDHIRCNNIFVVNFGDFLAEKIFKLNRGYVTENTLYLSDDNRTKVLLHKLKYI